MVMKMMIIITKVTMMTRMSSIVKPSEFKEVTFPISGTLAFHASK